MENKNLEIRIKARDVSTKDGKKFRAYKAVTKGGALIDTKFRKDITDIPAEDDFIAVVPFGGCNKDTRRLYPCLWISEVLDFKPVVVDEEALRKQAAESVADLFD